MTSTYPILQLLPYEIDFDAFFGTVTGKVRESRKARRLRDLVPNTILIGKESLVRQIAAPSIVLVPTGFRFASARTFPDQFDPRPIFSQWMILEVVCWGEDDPDKLNALHSFSSTLELAREVIVALCDSNYGPSSVKVVASEWVQETDINRSGRKLALRIEVETFVVRDPPIMMPSVSASVTGYLQLLDGTSTVQQASFVVPP